ncbi:MAG: nickel/cobalt efflux transporter RcnA [Bdellovibrio sp.]|nr:nickel/cobalt efflux transporter RcnA [Bdellovibrio sp.]
MSPIIDNPLSWVYFPTALMLGALHALEPGHAKTLTAAYLIGIKGTKMDALFLGLSVAFTHSFVVVAISVLALWVGRETFTQDVTHWLQIGSGVIVIILGTWMLLRRIRQMRLADKKMHGHAEHHDHDHNHDHGHHHDHDHKHDHQSNGEHDHNHQHHSHDHETDHATLDDEAHARAHMAAIPEYVKRGERPTLFQIIAFGAAGGMIPCPASITVMLLALSVGQFGAGVFAVSGFSLGLAIALVSVGLVVVAGINRMQGSKHFDWFSKRAPIISASVVIFSGIAALLFAH